MHGVVISYTITSIKSKDSPPRPFQPGRIILDLTSPSRDDTIYTTDSGLEYITPTVHPNDLL